MKDSTILKMILPKSTVIWLDLDNESPVVLSSAPDVPPHWFEFSEVEASDAAILESTTNPLSKAPPADFVAMSGCVLIRKTYKRWVYKLQLSSVHTW